MKNKMMFCIGALFLISLGLLASRSLGGGEQDNAQFKLALTEKEANDLAEYLKPL